MSETDFEPVAYRMGDIHAFSTFLILQAREKRLQFVAHEGLLRRLT